MTAPADAPRNEGASGLRVAAALFAGAALLAAVDSGAIALTLPRPPGGVSLRLSHHLFDAAETLGVGAVAGGAAGAFVRLTRLPRWACALAAVVASTALTHLVIGEELTRMASLTRGGRSEAAIFVAYLAVVGVALPATYVVGALAARRAVTRIAAVALAVGLLAADQVPFPDDYNGVHCVVAWGVAMLGGAALAPLVERAGRSLASGRRGRVALAVFALFALFGVVVPPPNATRFELFRQPCALAPWVLATTVWRAPRLHAPVAPPPSPWSRDRAADPAVPATSPRLLPESAVVVLVTVDALRADVVSDPANDAVLPTLAEMKRDGVVFTHASAPGTQTALSLSTLFTGRYFSELHWTDHGEGRTRYLYPADDPSIRFPQILSEHGVTTVDVAGLVFLGEPFGVVRGFREETVTVRGWRHAEAHELIDPLIARLHRPPRGPLFLYTHLMEPHEPYDRGRKDGTDRERYLSEVTVADAHIGRLLRYLEQRYGKRWVLFVSADHGEAFGEHRSYQHGKTLYEELLHVPLLARGPLLAPRVVEERVGLVDLGPTILDLFGLETPATFLGQSLVPLLGGGAPELTRPLVAEGRLRRALTLPDGLKVIEDLRRKVVEVYDLSADPGETQNLFDAAPARADPALAALRAFFVAHTRRGGGYEPPYKP